MLPLILASSPFIFVILVVMAIVIILITVYFSKKNVILRELKKTRNKEIHRVRQNEYVKLVGKAVGGNNLLIAPLSKRPCVYYYVLVERRGDKSWHKFTEEEQMQDFFLETNSERAMIKPGQTHFNFRKSYLCFDYEDNSGSFNDAKPHLEAFLKKQGKESTGLFGFNKTLRFKEGIIEPNERIAVKGVAAWKTLSQPLEGYSYSKILTLIGTTDEKLIITDHPEAVKPIQKKL